MVLVGILMSNYLLFEHVILMWIFVIIFSIFLLLRYRSVGILFCIILLCFNVLNSHRNKVLDPLAKEGLIIKTASSFYIVRTLNQDVLVYSDEQFLLHDHVLFKGQYQPIESVNNTYGLNFKKMMMRQHIHFQIKPTDIERVESKPTILNRVHQSISQMPHRSYYEHVYLNIQSEHEELKGEILSSQIIIVLFIRFLRSLFNKRFDDTYFDFYEVLLYMVMMLIFNDPAFYFMLGCRRLIQKIPLESFDKLALSPCVTLFLFPSFQFSLRFIIVMMFQLLGMIQMHQKRFWHGFIVIVPILLNSFYKVDLFELILFPIHRILNLIYFIIGLIDIVFKTSLSFNGFQLMNFNILAFNITGKFPLWILFLWIIVSLAYLRNGKFRYILMLFCLLIMNQNQLYFNPRFIFEQLYVGQGDSSLLIYPHQTKVMMVDTGSSYSYKRVESALNYYGINTIKHLMISHDDEDHSGNLKQLEQDFKIEHIMTTADDFQFYDLNIHLYQYDEEGNDGSLIAYFTINEYTYLLLGDVSSRIEHEFLNEHSDIQFDIVKIAHHGSKTSTSSQLLSHPSIKLLINSSGLNNRYQHPAREVVQRIMKHDLPFLDTQDYGNIKIISLYNLTYISLKP